MAGSSLLQCPNCSRLLRFSSDGTTMIVCAACGTVSWRDPNGTISTGPQFAITEKNDLIQPGTSGNWQDKKFTVLGRFRTWFEEAVFNYWTIIFEDGTIAWLGEGYGIYSIMLKEDNAENISSFMLHALHPGETEELQPSKPFLLRKKQKVIRWETEGEVFIPQLKTNFDVFDFSTDDDSHISIFEWEREHFSFYKVAYTNFQSLSLKDLREYTHSTKTYTCASCTATNAVKTFPYAQSSACINCGLAYALRNTMHFKPDELKAVKDPIHLPPGSKGIVNNILYEVIGYTRKQEKNAYHSEWTEYTLFNAGEGFAVLSEYEGNWIYIRERQDSPILLNQNLKEFYHDDEPFQLFNSYTYKVLAARGEFPYNIFDNESTKAREFISPPEIWIEERDSKEGITWYFGEHITPGQIKKAFNLSTMPAKKGIGAVQPSGFINPVRMVVISLIAVFLLIVAHLAINGTKEERVLLNSAYVFPDSANTISFVTEKFNLDKWRSNICFGIKTTVYNSWFELGATLVNAETGKEYTIEHGVEYYAGYSDGEHWTEGSPNGEAYLTQIPAGNYFLQLQGTREMNSTGGPPSINTFYLDIVYDVPVARNLWWTVALLLLWPAGRWLISNYYEKQRWSNSPYSSYNA